MTTTIKAICFTDIKDSTKLTRTLGHADYMPLLHEHLELGVALARLNKGRYKKNIGDAHLVVYDSVEDALAFATQMQELCGKSKLVSQASIEVRIGLSVGDVEESEKDVFGNGVNFASRVESLAKPGQIICNDRLVTTAAAAYGQSNDSYFREGQSHILKGFEDLGPQRVFEVNHQAYSSSRHGRPIAGAIIEHFSRCDVDTKNLNVRDLASPGDVIWPVVPRDLVTAIHRGQLEVMRLLCRIGWNVIVLIADCGEPTPLPRGYVDTFEQSLRAYALRRHISFAEIVRLSSYYEIDHPHYGEVQKHFRSMVEGMKVSDLMALNAKSYNPDYQERIKQQPTLAHLRPPLTLAAVLFLASRTAGKSAVVAGQDEDLQWNYVYNIPGSRESMCALLIPTLTVDRKFQAMQAKRWPIWESKRELEVALADISGNVGHWVYLLHALLPAFPSFSVDLGGHSISPESWHGLEGLPPHLSPKVLGDCVWKILDSAM